jgi:hypothetical protein
VNAIKQGDTISSIDIEGDTTALFEQMADDIARWNTVLDRQ